MALPGDTDMNYEETTLKTQRFPQPKYMVNRSTICQPTQEYLTDGPWFPFLGLGIMDQASTPLLAPSVYV